MFSRPLLYALLTGGLLMAACGSTDVFEKNIAIPEQAWDSKFTPEVNFEITDTTAEYNIYAVIRHSDAYRYNNIWLNIYTMAPGDSIHKQRVDLRLATDSDGWLGSGMDDIFEHRILLTRTPLSKRGVYRFRLENIMREDPLQHVLNAGVRVEKAKS